MRITMQDATTAMMKLREIEQIVQDLRDSYESLNHMLLARVGMRESTTVGKIYKSLEPRAAQEILNAFVSDIGKQTTRLNDRQLDIHEALWRQTMTAEEAMKRPPVEIPEPGA